MLPPYFKEAKKGEFYNVHEIDNFIEVEIAYGGKARASLTDEGGDIIMKGGYLDGQILDPLGLKNDYKFFQRWKTKFPTEYKNFEKSIKKHFEKIYSPPENLPSID